MKKYLYILLSFTIVFNANSENLNFSHLIPGEGVTEASIEVGSGEMDIDILAVRDISSEEFSNLFSQLSLHTQEVNGDGRMITNLGIGYRTLNDDKSTMIGVNAFLDYDFEGHTRASVGFEAKGALLDFTANTYQNISNVQTIGGTDEQVLSGYEVNLASQIPFMPWSKINWQNYSWEADKGKTDTEGNKYSLEMALSPSIQLDFIGDFSDVSGVPEAYEYRVTYNYPPKENKKTLSDGLFSSLAFEKENVEQKLKEKVRRSNNMVVEVQGSIIITSK